ncbi:glucosaminidase domain-containing protein [Rubrolithibacter danxiaensis]|uniref:glucosaminidase domain-containing protein n=1 Tax=Rubrolithibacter danxiaensis TaxID=3390805 RepID=UPI003BF7F059
MRLFILLIGLALLTSCSSRKTTLKANQPAQRVRKVFGETVLINRTSAEEYINRFKGIAAEEMNLYGIPASITLAQGLLESANGNSTLAREANNHFGIKCNSDWRGPTILRDDDQLDECFRVYNNPEESFRDHSEFLKRKRYAFLFEMDKDDYRGWAYGLKQAGYATNPKYPELLIGLIERYGLDQYDKKETVLAKAKREDRVMDEINSKPPVSKAQEPEKTPVAMKIYEVKQGDTLYSISKRFALTVEEIKILNGIQNTDIKLGQLLLVSK